MSDNPPEHPTPLRQKKPKWKFVVLGVLGVILLGLLWSYSDYRRSLRDNLTPEHAQILEDVWNDYGIDDKYRLCNTIERHNEEAGLSRFGLHYVQEVDRRGEEIADVGVPSEKALKNAAEQGCEHAFGGTKWWDERETRPDGPVPISDLLKD